MNIKKFPGPEKTFFGANADKDFYFNILEYLFQLQSKYGEAVHFNAMKHNMYLISDIDLVEKILVKHPDKFLKGTSVQRLKIIIGTGLISSEGEIHDTHRLMLANDFKKNNVVKYFDFVKESVSAMISKWEKISKQNDNKIEIHSEAGDLYVDVIMRSIFSDDVSDEIISTGQKLNRLFYNASPLLLVAPKLSLKLPVPEAIRFKKTKSAFDKLLKSKIKNRFNSGIRKNDLLDTLIYSKSKTGYSMSEDAVFNEVITFFLAAADTTSKTLSWVLYLITKNPEIFSKVNDEFNKNISEKINYDEFNNLIYTKCLIAESLRLYPPVWAISRCPVENVILNGLEFKKDSTILIFPYYIHRMEKYFKSANECIPERWMSKDSAKFPKYAYIPFGAGPRVCLGDNFAWMELFTAMAFILKKFNLNLITKSDPGLSSAITLKPKKDIIIEISNK
ncbi:MAG TPA: cytochrome P450 [Ignavibacteria bacterium]|nr:cytochrome P450 [Ignavibacteria bacterium]